MKKAVSCSRARIDCSGSCSIAREPVRSELVQPHGCCRRGRGRRCHRRGGALTHTTAQLARLRRRAEKRAAHRDLESTQLDVAGLVGGVTTLLNDAFGGLVGGGCGVARLECMRTPRGVFTPREKRVFTPRGCSRRGGVHAAGEASVHAEGVFTPRGSAHAEGCSTF